MVGNGKLFEWIKDEVSGDKKLVYHKENVATIFKVDWLVLTLTVAIIFILVGYMPMANSCKAVVQNACDYCGVNNACTYCFAKGEKVDSNGEKINNPYPNQPLVLKDGVPIGNDY